MRFSVEVQVGGLADQRGAARFAFEALLALGAAIPGRELVTSGALRGAEPFSLPRLREALLAASNRPAAQVISDDAPRLVLQPGQQALEDAPGH